MEFKKVPAELYAESIALQAKSYMNYEYYTAALPDERRRYAFLEALMTVALNVFTKEGVQLGCFEGGQLLAVALILPPSYKPAGFFKYLANGGFRVIRAGGLRTTLKWLKMDEQATATIFKMTEPHWLIESVTVSDACKGQGIGSTMMNKCIFPYIAKQGGRKAVLITNSDPNSRFYKKNGFEEVDYRTITCGDKMLGNWTFEYNLEEAFSSK